MPLISRDEWENLRQEIKQDLIVSFNELKKIAQIIAVLVVPWLPAYIVYMSFNQARVEQDRHYLNAVLGSVSGYMDSLFTLQQTCKAYRRASELREPTAALEGKFTRYLLEANRWRTHLSRDSVTLENSLGKRVGQLTSELMLTEAYYGLTAKTYCAHTLLSEKELVAKERRIRRIAVEDNPFLQLPPAINVD